MSNHVPVNNATTCPQCGGGNIEMFVSTPPRCFRCLIVRHAWNEPYLRPARDRRGRAKIHPDETITVKSAPLS